MGQSEQEQIKKLRAKVRELEVMVSTQQKLVEIMKTMPGCQGVKLEDGDKKSKPRVLKSAQNKSGPVAQGGSTRESENSGKIIKCDPKNVEVMES